VNYNSYDFVSGHGFNFTQQVSVIDPIEFLNFIDIPIEEMGKSRGLSEVEILKFYGWEVIE